jgi:hypothetical protein
LKSDLTFTCIIIRKCNSLGITLVFGKLVDLYQELSLVNNEAARMMAHYCGSYLVFVLCGFASFDADLVLCVHELERVERYLYDGFKVRPSRVRGVSLRKDTPSREGVPHVQIISDSSDSLEVDQRG